MVRARLFNLLVLLALISGLGLPSPVMAQETEPHQPATVIPVMQSVTSPDPQEISPQGGSWFGSNLIMNGDAEANPPGRPTTGWTGGTNDFIVISSYGDTGYPLPNDPGPMNRGTRFFRASKQASEINAWQSIDITGLTSAVDTGQVGFHMNGFFGGLGSSNDYALLRVYFEAANGQPVPGSSPVAIGSVTAADRMNKTGLLERSTLGKLPAGTRRLTFQLQMKKGGTSNPDALADNLSFILENLKVMLPLVIGGNAQPTHSVPAAPTNLVATGDSLTTIQLTWIDNAADETGYLIERASAGSGSYTTLARTVSNVTEYHDKGLTPQSGYTYRVSAYNEVGPSTAVTANGTTQSNPATPPAAPASCWTSNTSAQSTVVGWADSSINEDYFTLEMQYSGQNWYLLANIEPGATYVIVTDLLPDAYMRFRIAAHNAAGFSAWCTTPLAHTSTLANVLTVENQASYPIVYLAVDGVNQFPVYPMGILSGGSYQMNLPAGHHTVEIRTGFWQSRTSRFDMYTYYDEFDMSSGSTTTMTVPDVSLEGILTQFNASGEGYWEGYYFDANLNCRTAAFRFYTNGQYKFYVSNAQQDQGSYSLVSRAPSTFSLKFSVPGYEGYLLEQYGEFYMSNGPASWKQITYNYKPQGYVYSSFCP